MIKLFIDDIRDPCADDFIVVRSYGYAVNYMRKNGCPDFISFDHDLGEANELTGFDIAKWMVERDLNDKGKFIPKDFKFYVHSANPAGSANINGLLNNYLEVRNVRRTKQSST